MDSLYHPGDIVRRCSDQHQMHILSRDGDTDGWLCGFYDDGQHYTQRYHACEFAREVARDCGHTSWMEVCQFIIDTFKMPLSARQLYLSSPTGELGHIYALHDAAHEYLEKKSTPTAGGE